MKHYAKTFEDVYASDAVKKKCELGDISIANGISPNEYAALVRSTISDALRSFFDYSVKLAWLQLQYKYKGRSRAQIGMHDIATDYSLFAFYGNVAGRSPSAMAKTMLYSKLVTYFHDFYQDFDLHDPFKEPEYYKFPYDKITPDYLLVVYQMPERMQLLARANAEEMNYATFMDYVLNYILSYNEEVGRDVFAFVKNYRYIPYIKYADYEANKKFKKKNKNKPI